MIGDKVKELRKHLGMTQKELAERLGLKSQTTIAAIEKSKNRPSNELLSNMADFFNVSTDFLLGKREASEASPELKSIITQDYISIPILGVVRAGWPILENENMEEHIPLTSSMVNRYKEYFALKIEEASMNIEFREGSTIVVEKTNQVEDGDIGVIIVNGYAATVKKVVRKDNMITLIPMSTNSAHMPAMYDTVKEQIQIIGKVKYAIKGY